MIFWGGFAIMMDAGKYNVGYYPAPGRYCKWVEKDHIEKAPIWCSVDLRDGNQSPVSYTHLRAHET